MSIKKTRLVLLLARSYPKVFFRNIETLFPL